MTTRILTMPRLGETMEEGTVVGWLVKPGEAFQRGAPILEVETDKTIVEYPALGDGVLEETLVHEGDRVSVGAAIARVAVSDPGEWEEEAASATDPVAASAWLENSPTMTGSASPAVAAAASGVIRPRATPRARRLARHAGVALEAVSGTGRRDRIERRDVEAAISGSTPARPKSVTGRIAFETVGQGAKTLVLIHGFAGDRSAWAVTANGLARMGRRVILPDLPSHGETEVEAETLDDLVREMGDFVGALEGTVHLVGHSLGAAVAVGLAGRFDRKIASVTLIAPAGAGREINADFVHGMGEAVTVAEIAHLLRLLGPKGGEISGNMLAAMAAEARRGRLKALANALAGSQGQQRIDILHALNALPAGLPVGALIGTEDRIIPAHHAFNLPSRVAVHFLRAGHMPQWDTPREVVALLSGVVDG